MKAKIAVMALSIAALLLPARMAGAAVRVVCTIPELASIAREVGGSRVTVISLAKPDQNYHRIEARPSDVRRVADADLFVRVGMDLEMWADALLSSARNRKVAKGGPGYVDTSVMIRKREIPNQAVTGASGDIHVEGNPHYWLDPGNAKVIAYQVLLGLRAVDPKGKAAYNANYTRFAAEIDRRMKGWTAAMAPFRGKPVVAYHAEWSYFYGKFGLRPFGYLEPKPGIPPGAGHVNALIRRMKASGVKAVVVPSVYPTRFADVLKRDAGANVVRVPYSVGSMGTTDYISYMDAIINGFRKALS